MTTDTGPTWGMSYRPTLAEAIHDLTRLVADGRCLPFFGAEMMRAEVRHEAEVRKVDVFGGARDRGEDYEEWWDRGFGAMDSALYLAKGQGARVATRIAELLAEIGESLLENAAPVGHAPRREEGGEGSRFGGDGETVPEEGGEVKGEEEA
jgi:hypothetical protein